MRNHFTPKRLVAVAVAAAVVVGAVAAVGARSDSGPSYRTAKASTQEVDQVLHAVATVEPVSQASVAFPVAGTVDAVDVSVGDSVTVGKRLAALDVADLQDAVDEKQAALDQANLTLELALSGEDVGSVSGGSPSGGFGRSATAGTSAEIKAAQQAVLDAQEAVDESSAAAALALDNAATVCSAAAAAAPAGEDAGSTTTTEASSGTTACLAALQAVQAAQQQVSADQAALTAAADALTALLAQESENPETPTTTTPTTTPSNPDGSNGSNGSNGSASGGDTTGGAAPSGSDGSNGATDGTGGTGDSASSSPSAEDLIAYQKQVDAAEDELAVAEQAVDQATIVSPIDGIVASVGMAVGDDVEAASATQNIVIVGNGGFEVTTSVSVKDLPDIEVGQRATVLPDGDSEAVTGEVVRIGVTADSSSSTTSYPVTIALTGDTSAMGNGSTASVVIVTSAAEDALAVPTSAVTVDGDRATVQVVTDGKAKATTVETGAVGQTWTEITDGIEEGDEVVLADLDEPLPGSATDTSSNAGNGQERQFTGGPMVMMGGPPSGARPGN